MSSYLCQDKRGTIEKIAEFLGKSLTDEDVDRIIEHTSLQYMKNNDKVNMSYIEKYRETDKTEGAFINKGNIINIYAFSSFTVEIWRPSKKLVHEIVSV